MGEGRPDKALGEGRPGVAVNGGEGRVRSGARTSGARGAVCAQGRPPRHGRPVPGGGFSPDCPWLAPAPPPGPRRSRRRRSAPPHRPHCLSGATAAAAPGRPPASRAEPETAASPGRSATAGPQRPTRARPRQQTSRRAYRKTGQPRAGQDFRTGGGPPGGRPSDEAVSQ